MVASGTWTDPLDGANYPFAGRLPSDHMNAWIAGLRAIDRNVVTSAIRTWPHAIAMDSTNVYKDAVFDSHNGVMVFVGTDSGGTTVVVCGIHDWNTITGGANAATGEATTVDQDGLGNVVLGRTDTGSAAATLVQLSTSSGASWTAKTLPYATMDSVPTVIWNGSVFIAAYCDFSTDAYIATSPDGDTWTNRTNPLSNVGWAAKAYGGAATDGNGKVVLIPSSSPSQFVYSADGLTWQTVNLTSASWHSVIYTPSYGWIAFSIDGATIWESSNGTTWSASTTATVPADALSPAGVIGIGAIGDTVVLLYYYSSDCHVVYSTDGCVTWSDPIFNVRVASGAKLRTTGGRLVVLDDDNTETIYMSARTPIGD